MRSTTAGADPCRARRSRTASRARRASLETYAIPMPRSRHGENVPLVTSPPPTTGLPWRAIPCPSITNGTSFSAGPAARARGDRLGADEAGLPPCSTSRARPRSGRAPRSGRCRTGGSRPRGAACRARRARPASRRPASSASQTAGASLGVEQQLDPVLARVAGAAHQHRDAGHGALAAVHARRQLAVGEPLARARARSGPGRRASRSPRSRSITSTSNPPACARIHARSRSWLAALVTVRKCSRPAGR